jgi:Membrane proteins related to metalloendopeptidases
MVMVRPVNYSVPYTETAAGSKKQIDAFFARLDASGAKVSSLVPSGKSVLGFKTDMPYVAKKMQERKITLGMVEGVTQLQFAPAEGLTELAKLTGYQVARTYVIDKIEQKRMSMYDAFRRWALSDEERNIRINYIKTFLTPRDGKTLLATNVDYVDKICRSVEQKGFTSGEAGIFKPYLSNAFLILPLIFAVVAAWVIYAGLLFNLSDRKQYILLLFGGLLLSAGLFVPGKYTIVRLTVALGSATMTDVDAKKKTVEAKAAERRALYDKALAEQNRLEQEYNDLMETSNNIASMIKNWEQSGTLGSVNGSGRFIWPIHGEITSPYGWRTHPIFGTQIFHSGIDIAADYGDPILAADSGTVIYAGWMGGYGNAVMIDHAF